MSNESYLNEKKYQKNIMNYAQQVNNPCNNQHYIENICNTMKVVDSH